MKEKQICKNCGKEKVIHARGYCSGCYQKLLYNGELKKDTPKCKVEGCEKFSRANGYCMRHINQLRYNGKITDSNPNRSHYDSNEIVLYEDYAEIVMYDTKCYEKARAIIDIEDVDKLKEYKWNCEVNLHVHSGNTWLHRLLMNCNDDNLVVDHINHNPLDNRKGNLRICTPQENGMNNSLSKTNTTGIIGICYIKQRDTWQANITVKSKVISLGEYNNKEDAIKERLKAEVYYMKEFAPQRHLYTQYGTQYGIDEHGEYEVKQYTPRKKGNEHGVKGVFKGSGNNKDRWKVEFQINGKHIYLGHYDTIEKAIEVRQAYQG
jgi:hypothetical protein